MSPFGQNLVLLLRNANIVICTNGIFVNVSIIVIRNYYNRLRTSGQLIAMLGLKREDRISKLRVKFVIACALF